MMTERIDRAFSVVALNFSGGKVREAIEVDDAAVVNLFGGEIVGGLEASGELNVFGGSIQNDLLALANAVVTIFGNGFNLPFGDITATSGTLTGTLADGAPLNVNFGRASTATITLVPEPPEFVLLVAGAGFLWVLYRRRVRGTRVSTE